MLCKYLKKSKNKKLFKQCKLRLKQIINLLNVSISAKNSSNFSRQQIKEL